MDNPNSPPLRPETIKLLKILAGFKESLEPKLDTFLADTLEDFFITEMNVENPSLYETLCVMEALTVVLSNVLVRNLLIIASVTDSKEYGVTHLDELQSFYGESTKDFEETRKAYMEIVEQLVTHNTVH